MADSLDAFLDSKDDDLDSFLDGKSDGSMSAARHRGQQAADWIGSTPYLGSAAAGLSGALQGGTFGFSDELGGALGFLTGNGYENSRDTIRQFQDRLGEQHPVANFVGDLAGSVVVPGAGAKYAMRGVDAARNARRAKMMSPEDKATEDLLNAWSTRGTGGSTKAASKADDVVDEFDDDVDDLFDDVVSVNPPRRPQPTTQEIRDAIKEQMSSPPVPYGGGRTAMNKITDGMIGGAGAGALRAAGENEDNYEIVGDMLQGGALGSILGGVGGGLKAGGELAGEAFDVLKGRPQKQVMDLITGLDPNSQMGKAIMDLYDADPKLVEKLYSRFAGPKIDLTGITTKALEYGGPAARRTGNAMMSPWSTGPFGSAMGAASAERLDDNDLFLDAEPLSAPSPRSAPPPGPDRYPAPNRTPTPSDQDLGPSLTKYLSNPRAMVAKAAGTPYERQLEDAAFEGPESLRATVFVLSQRPEFRKAMGLD